MTRPRAVLLLGPTGSGKTPLGKLLEKRGLAGRRCIHFDFGSQLRRIAHGSTEPPGFTKKEVQCIRAVLRRDALLEDEHFPIAEKVLRAFIAERGIDADAFVVLNGLPRHVGQACGIERFVEVQVVVELSCKPRVVLERIRANTGGDRAGRSDDDPGSVERRLALYGERTAPLLEHYRRRAVRIETIHVGAKTTAEDVAQQLSRRT